jgi:hypothetical protein
MHENPDINPVGFEWRTLLWGLLWKETVISLRERTGVALIVFGRISRSTVQWYFSGRLFKSRLASALTTIFRRDSILRNTRAATTGVVPSFSVSSGSKWPTPSPAHPLSAP